jgi:glycosyltransferase involved in cell wall biosynthesis
MLTGYTGAFHLTALRYAMRTGRPVIFRGETTDHAVHRNRVKSILRDCFLARLYRKCFRLLYIGVRSKEHFVRLGSDESKLLFSPYCVDVDSFRPDERTRDELRNKTRERLAVAPSEYLLLFSGKLSFRKGPDLLLDGIELLPAVLRKRIAVAFVGSGHMERDLKARCSHLPEIHFIGFKNQSCLSEYYHAADLLVLPSRFGETWGLVQNEALHHGLPAVVSQCVGSAPDLTLNGITGETFLEGSAASLSQAIERAVRLIGQPEVRTACRRQAAAYSVAEAARGICSAYAAVC